MSTQSALATPVSGELEALGKRLNDLAAETNWELPVKRGQPLAGKDLQHWLLEREERALKDKVERGVGYMLLKRELGHGAFIAWVRERGLSERTAQENMKVAQMLMQLSAPHAKRASNLPHRKLQVLAGLPPPVIEELYEDGALDQAETMSRDELAEIVKLRRDLANQKAKAETLGLQLDKVREDAAGKPSDWPLPVRRAREEGFVFGGQAVALADELAKELAHLEEAIRNDAVDAVGAHAGVSAIYFAALQAHQRFGQIATEIVGYYEGIGDDNRLEPLLPDALARVKRAVAIFTETFRGEAAGRDILRTNSEPGRRGRKRTKA